MWWTSCATLVHVNERGEKTRPCVLRLNYNFRLRLQQSVVFMTNVEWVSLELKALTNVRLWTGFGERSNSNECAVCSNRIELSNEKVRSHEMLHRTANIRLSKKPTKPPTFTSERNKNRFKWRLLNLFGKCMYACARILLSDCHEFHLRFE